MPSFFPFSHCKYLRVAQTTHKEQSETTYIEIHKNKTREARKADRKCEKGTRRNEKKMKKYKSKKNDQLTLTVYNHLAGRFTLIFLPLRESCLSLSSFHLSSFSQRSLIEILTLILLSSLSSSFHPSLTRCCLYLPGEQFNVMEFLSSIIIMREMTRRTQKRKKIIFSSTQLCCC